MIRWDLGENHRTFGFLGEQRVPNTYVDELENVLGVEHVAQTNLQLFAQLRAANYSGEDLALVRRAHDFAIRLYAGAYRGSGKPVLAHAIGVASILAMLGASAAVIATAIAHAAYVHGEFGDGYRGISDRKRKYVRACVGDEVEGIMARYFKFGWGPNRTPEILKGLSELTPDDREVLLIRLANELEDHLDLGILFCAGVETRLAKIENYLHMTIEMANYLGYPALANALAKAFDESRTADLPAELAGGKITTYYLAPASHELRLELRLRKLVRAAVKMWRRRTRSFLRT